jgi:hypothetical protein
MSCSLSPVPGSLMGFGSLVIPDKRAGNACRTLPETFFLTEWRVWCILFFNNFLTGISSSGQDGGFSAR